MLVLVRIDDRLIHGQVTVGWGGCLRPDRILLANDEVAENPWEQDLYISVAPPETEICVATVEEAAEKVQEEQQENTRRTILLVNSPRDALRLVEYGAPIREINVGGLHFREGRHQILPFVFADQEDIEAFRSLLQRGVQLECRDVPTCRKTELNKILR